MIHQLRSEPFPQTLIQLKLNNNYLSNVDYSYKYIPNIDFSLNNVTFLDRMTNRSLVKSYTLDFHGNFINYIVANAFQFYIAIDHLDLSNNYFDLNFTKTYFGRYLQCRCLNLTNNNITSVRDLFYRSAFRTILEIDLSHNYITEVRDLKNHNHQVALQKLHMALNIITGYLPKHGPAYLC